MTNNVTTYLFATDDNSGKILAKASRKTAKGVSNWANRMYLKYGDHMTVEEYRLYDDGSLVRTGTWHA